ncbi:FtsK/SpoIIIE domain-containing protein [Cellulomonas denverensis]|uniref:FtsK/SpoIIIE domain-containing protein n=1 Tax=Cellulomonas denverensis TaxID=264297 RepID=UPI0035EBE8E7
MRTRVVLRRPRAATPVTITTEATATVGDLADALVRADPASAVPGEPELSIHRPDDVDFRRIRRDTSLSEAGFRAGSTIAVTPRDASEITSGSAAVARLVVVAGPDSGQEIELGAGVATIGRGPDCDLRLTDSQVSRLHARLLVGDQIEVVDAGSANGVLIGDGPVSRSVVRPDDILVLGNTQLQVLVIDPDATDHTTGATGAVVAYNRSPRLVQRYPERTVPAPDVPTPPNPTKFPILALIAPMVMGAAMFTFTRNPMSLMFVALSPMMMLGNWWNSRSSGKKKFGTESVAFDEALDLLRRQIEVDHTLEREARLAESPATRETVGAALGLAPVLWSARPREPGFLTLRLGTGTAPSRTVIEPPNRGTSDPQMWERLRQTLAELTDVPGVPHVADLTDLGVLGVAGEIAAAEPVARALLAQIACLHSPAELVIAGVASHASAARWDWLSWLPHVDSPHSPLGAHLATSPAACATVITQVEELIAQRTGGNSSRNGPPLPWVVLLVEDDAPAERGRLVRIAEEGLAAGVIVIWRADTQRRLPASCRAVLIADEAGARTGRTEDGIWYDVVPETLDEVTAMTLGRHLAGVTDAGALTLDESDLPRAVGYLGVAGAEIAADPGAVVERWHETGSILNRQGEPVRRGSDAHLRGVIGQGTDGEFVLDLRSQGPHALVGGTTGAGKSEFLQAWVMGMAAAHSPDRVTFLFVDYKGGAAFADCVKLPHCVGLVTDLAGHLVRRALTSLRAELRYREHLLSQAQAKDLLSLERTGDPRTPPALVIVVDEFAALVQEIPEFVDGVVDVAQRGRSLGLHLVLATQRPAGVIKDNLRANTNLRIALRMADESDSSDVLGSPMAAHFDPRIPGRGAVRTGPGRLAMFQTGYVGGRSDSARPGVDRHRVPHLRPRRGVDRPTPPEALIPAPRTAPPTPPGSSTPSAAPPNRPTSRSRAGPGWTNCPASSPSTSTPATPTTTCRWA